MNDSQAPSLVHEFAEGWARDGRASTGSWSWTGARPSAESTSIVAARRGGSPSAVVLARVLALGHDALLAGDARGPLYFSSTRISRYLRRPTLTAVSIPPRA